jgi:hypothetical protein
MPENAQLQAGLFDVLGQDNHRYFIGVIEHTSKKKFFAPIPPVRVKATGMLIEPTRQVELQKELKQKVLKELLRQLETGLVTADDADSWYEDSLAAVEASLYQPVVSCQPADID